MEMISSAGEIFSKQRINLNLSLTKNIPVPKAFGMVWLLLDPAGVMVPGRGEVESPSQVGMGVLDEYVGSPASEVDGAGPNQAVIE